MVEAAEKSGCINMTGFNYIRTPASQLARQIIASRRDRRHHLLSRRAYGGFSGRSSASRLLAHARAAPMATWAILSPHIINATLALAGPITLA